MFTTHINDLTQEDLENLYSILATQFPAEAHKHEATIKDMNHWHAIMESDIVATVRASDHDNMIVGFGQIIAIHKAFTKYTVEEIVRHPDYGRCGIGEMIMHTLHSEAAKRNISEISLTSNPARKTARALYEKLGYQLAGETGKFTLTLKS